MIKNQYTEGEYLITEYESGAIIKVLQSQEPSEAIPELPKNPILEAQQQIKVLSESLAQEKINSMKKDELAINLTKEVANLKLEIMKMKGGNQ